jgi:hypothetical protein
MFDHFFSLDNPKAVKAQKYGWLNAINYMAPHRLAGVGNLCPHASPGCIELCLGITSGNAALYPTVLKSRIAKAQWFTHDRGAFIAHMANKIHSAAAKAQRDKLRLCVRLNGATDIAWEGVTRDIRGMDGRPYANVFTAFPNVQFVDYTKSVKRALAHARGQLPPNYHLTFSRSETNEAQCLEVLAAGGNIAVVSSLPRPEAWNGYPTIDGDAHDLRHLDSFGVVWLSPKGAKAKTTKSGFVLR